MFEHFRIELLPEARSGGEIARNLANFGPAAHPAVVVREAGDTLEDALAFIEPHLPPTLEVYGPLHETEFSNVTHDGKGGPIFNIDTATYQGDYGGLHVDAGDPAEPCQVNFYHLDRGEVNGYFFLPSPSLVMQLARFNRTPLPDNTTQLFRQGQVNTEFLQPVCRYAHLRAGDLLIFNEGLPLPHGFDTVVAPRHARVRHGRLPQLPPLTRKYVETKN
jgi:hypothetical protein